MNFPFVVVTIQNEFTDLRQHLIATRDEVNIITGGRRDSNNNKEISII